jgi:hypothetical protein
MRGDVSYFYPDICQAEASDGDSHWVCTLDDGHTGSHEAHGASPLPIWGDDDSPLIYADVAEDDE